MKTSITVINIPESMEISIKGPTYAYKVTSEYPDKCHWSISNRYNKLEGYSRHSRQPSLN